MPRIIQLPTFQDHRGSLTVIEKCLPFEVLRVYYIYGVKDPEVVRGKHSHHKTSQALIAINGTVQITCRDGGKDVTYDLNSPDQCLILSPEDWHTMHHFSPDSVLLVLASHYFDADDYIDDPAAG